MNKSIPMPSKNRVSVFIYESMNREGGIQSIVYRELDRAYEQGKIAYVISKPFKSSVQHYKNCRLDYEAKPEKLADAIIRRMSGGGWVIDIIALSPDAVPIAQLLRYALSTCSQVLDARACVTILHPRDFMRETEKRHVHLMNKLAGHAIGLKNLIFMNEQCRETHSAFFSRDLSANPIVPVPIDRREPRWTVQQETEALRIVAVGRIVDFKAYNFALPGILIDLEDRGYKVTCDIFGYGAEEPKLVRAIREAGASHLVRFKGPIHLEDFDNIVSNYDLFIGMGTAAVQAAQLGIPTILAIVDDPDGAHGFIQDAPFGNLGEQDKSVPRQGLGAMIEIFLRCGQVQRQSISNAGIAYANRYVADNYVEQLTEHAVARKGIMRHLAAAYCRFYIWMARDNWLRVVVRSVRQISRRGHPS